MPGRQSSGGGAQTWFRLSGRLGGGRASTLEGDQGRKALVQSQCGPCGDTPAEGPHWQGMTGREERCREAQGRVSGIRRWEQSLVKEHQEAGEVTIKCMLALAARQSPEQKASSGTWEWWGETASVRKPFRVAVTEGDAVGSGGTWGLGRAAR